MILRTSLGSIYRAISDDGGQTWGEPALTGLTAPVAPASIARIPATGDLLMIWNHAKDRRVPLTAAVSTDEGRTWGHILDLEGKGRSFAYTSITWVEETAVLSYWTQTEGGYGLKVTVVPVDWFYAEP